MEQELIEFYILVFITKDSSFLIKYAEYLFTNDIEGKKRKKVFEDKNYQILFDTVVLLFNKLGKIPKDETVKYLINRTFSDDGRKELLLNLVEKVFSFNEKTIDLELIDEEAEKYVKSRLFIEALEDSQTDIVKQDYVSASEKFSKAVNVNFDKDFGVSIKDWDTISNLIHEDNCDDAIVATGYRCFDKPEILNGGMRQGELGVIIAPSGVGKTLVLCNLAVNAFLDGKKVLLISFETSITRIISRVMSSLMNVTSRRISEGMMDTENVLNQELKEKFDNTIMKIPGDIRIKEYPSDEKSSNDIIAYMEDLKKVQDFEPEVIMLDYLLIMKANDKKMDRTSSYNYFRTVSEQIRNIAKRYKIPVWTAVQANRGSLVTSKTGGGTKEVIGQDSVADSKGIVDTADFVFSISQTEEQRKMNEMSFFIAKNRNGVVNSLFKMSVDYTHGLIKEINVS